MFKVLITISSKNFKHSIMMKYLEWQIFDVDIRSNFRVK